MRHNISSARVARGTIAAAAAIALLASCGSDSTGPKNANVQGSYTLTSVNGSSLPFTVPHTGEDVEVVENATLTLASDSTYSVNAAGTLNGSESQLITDVGHYVVSGNQVTFTSTIFAGAHYTASYTAGPTSNSLTASVPGAVVGSTDVSFTLTFESVV